MKINDIYSFKLIEYIEQYRFKVTKKENLKQTHKIHINSIKRQNTYTYKYD